MSSILIYRYEDVARFIEDFARLCKSEGGTFTREMKDGKIVLACADMAFEGISVNAGKDYISFESAGPAPWPYLDELRDVFVAVKGAESYFNNGKMFVSVRGREYAKLEGVKPDKVVVVIDESKRSVQVIVNKPTWTKKEIFG